MLQKRQSGNKRAKTHRWGGRCGIDAELHISCKLQKKQFSRELRNGKPIDLPSKGAFYKRIPGESKYKHVS